MSSEGLSRRRFFGLAGASTAGVIAAGAAGGAIGRATAGEPAPVAATTATDAVPFTGEHQAGIVTPAQDRLLAEARPSEKEEPAAAAAGVGSCRRHQRAPRLDWAGLLRRVFKV